jgi:predicted HTH transcriptional regulator
MMRRFRICEERGSGIDKVITQVELFRFRLLFLRFQKGLPVPYFLPISR